MARTEKLTVHLVDHLMFDEDPGSVKQGEAHWVMGYMKAWRPTFIYVNINLLAWQGKDFAYILAERIHTSA